MPIFYTQSSSTSIEVSGQPGSPSLDMFETTVHQPEETAEDAPGSTIYRHAYRTFGCKNCTAVHEYVALARCGDRTCPECRQVDYYRLYDAYKPGVVALGKHGLKLVTLTQVNRGALEGCIDDLREAWKKLRRRAPYDEVWKGGLYTIECVNKGRGWHVHLHVLVEGGYVSQAQLAADWKELTGDAFIVDIREVRHPVKGLRYVLKYLQKSPTVSGHEGEYNEVLKGKRLVQAFGSWYGQVRVKEEDEAPKLVCAVCGHSEWIVILQKIEMPLEEVKARREVMSFFEAKARAG